MAFRTIRSRSGLKTLQAEELLSMQESLKLAGLVATLSLAHLCWYTMLSNWWALLIGCCLTWLLLSSFFDFRCISIELKSR